MRKKKKKVEESTGKKRRREFFRFPGYVGFPFVRLPFNVPIDKTVFEFISYQNLIAAFYGNFFVNQEVGNSFLVYFVIMTEDDAFYCFIFLVSAQWRVIIWERKVPKKKSKSIDDTILTWKNRTDGMQSTARFHSERVWEKQLNCVDLDKFWMKYFENVLCLDFFRDEGDSIFRIYFINEVFLAESLLSNAICW